MFHSPDVDVERLEGLPSGRLLDVARRLPPEEDPRARLSLNVSQVRPSRTLHLLVHIEGGQGLVQTHKDLCVHKTLGEDKRDVSPSVQKLD